MKPTAGMPLMGRATEGGKRGVVGMKTVRREVGSRRTRLLLVVLSGVVLAAGIAAIVVSGDRDAGPLTAASTTNVEFPLAAGEAGTWGVDLPTNPGSSQIIVRSVEPLDPQGLEILGMAMINPDVSGGVIALRGHPLAGFVTAPIEGSVISPSGGASPHQEVVIGVRLAPGSTRGTIRGLRVRYAIDGREYEVDLPYSLTLVLPTASPPSPAATNR